MSFLIGLWTMTCSAYCSTASGGERHGCFVGVFTYHAVSYLSEKVEKEEVDSFTLSH